MKATSKWILPAVTSAVAVLGMHGMAKAETTESAVICKPAGDSNRAGLFTDSRGVRNGTAGNLDVVCPVLRTREPPSTGFVVKVDVGIAPATCTMYSFGQPDGGWRGQSLTVTAAAPLPRTLSLSIDAARVPVGSHQSVYCTLASGSRLFGIRPQQ
jgi:hypothetical protein